MTSARRTALTKDTLLGLLEGNDKHINSDSTNTELIVGDRNIELLITAIDDDRWM
jgi:hypothetical protein